jgi:hypothetical protein
LAAGVIAALAIAAPVAESSAATPIVIPLPPFTTLPAFLGPLISSVGPSGVVAMAIARPAIGDVFNGGTVVVVSTAPAVGTVIASP